MSSTTLHLDAPQMPLHEVCTCLTRRLEGSCQLLSCEEMDFLDGSAAQLLFEKLLPRSGGCASLAVFLTESDEGQRAHLTPFGGGANIFHVTLSADELVKEAAALLHSLGFRPSDDE